MLVAVVRYFEQQVGNAYAVARCVVKELPQIGVFLGRDAEHLRLLRELLDRNVVSKYNWEKGLCERIAVFEGALSNNGTKSTPCLQGDIVGDWREEVLLRTADNTALRLYVSTIPTDYRFHTFLEDPVYRISIATQNVAYNQPTQPGFYFGPELRGTIFRGCKIPKK